MGESKRQNCTCLRCGNELLERVVDISSGYFSEEADIHEKEMTNTFPSSRTE